MAETIAARGRPEGTGQAQGPYHRGLVGSGACREDLDGVATVRQHLRHIPGEELVASEDVGRVEVAQEEDVHVEPSLRGGLRSHQERSAAAVPRSVTPLQTSALARADRK